MINKNEIKLRYKRRTGKKSSVNYKISHKSALFCVDVVSVHINFSTPCSYCYTHIHKQQIATVSNLFFLYFILFWFRIWIILSLENVHVCIIGGSVHTHTQYDTKRSSRRSLWHTLLIWWTIFIWFLLLFLTLFMCAFVTV